MKIQYCSDLHLEFEDNTEYIKKHPLKPVGDYLVLAGDISYMSCIDKEDKWFFDWCSDNFRETWYIPGNHEFYDFGDISILEKPFRETIKPNVSFVNNTTIQIEGYTLLFTPLFSHIADVNNLVIRFCMRDFHRIFFHDKRFTIEDFNSLNKICVNFLEKELEKAMNPVMIFTHHVPSGICNNEEQNGSPVNEGYTNNLDELVLKYSELIHFWVFGHSHHRTHVKSGKTTFLSNPLGYVNEMQNAGFDPSGHIG